MNNNFTTTVRLFLASLFAFTMFAGVISAAGLLAFNWTWLATPMYTFYIGFAILLSISALVKIHRAYVDYDVSSKEDHNRRMIEMGFTTGISLMSWYLICNIDYSALDNNAKLVLTWITFFLAMVFFNEWFAKEDARTEVNEGVNHD